MYQDVTRKPWNSRQWAPEGYSTREEFETETKEERNNDRLTALADQGAKGTSDEKRLQPSEHRDENTKM